MEGGDARGFFAFSISAVQDRNHVAAARATAAAAKSNLQPPRAIGPAHAWRSVRRRLRRRTHRGVRRGARRAAASGSMRVGPDPPTTIPFPPHKRNDRPPFFPSAAPWNAQASSKKSGRLFGNAPTFISARLRHGTTPLRIRTARPIGSRHTGPPAPAADPLGRSLALPRFPRAAQSHSSSSVQFAAGGRDTHAPHST